MSPQQLTWAIVLAGYAAIVIVFYIVVIKPRRDAMRRHKELVESLSPGDKIVTAGGILGTVISVKDKTCVVEVARGMQITLQRAAVRARQDEELRGK